MCVYVCVCVCGVCVCVCVCVRERETESRFSGGFVTDGCKTIEGATTAGVVARAPLSIGSCRYFHRRSRCTMLPCPVLSRCIVPQCR